ncbi:Glycoside hydrolase, family 47 [Cordyceps fumosorosea ARSEF 2679]|uniref:alpha-1,2-Mannosidase n=1 Tax=Cordyceps fumosorosea (strain ARSEF 2679) TaxID=1081104 RepID=A0A167V0L8_CORFA|nr:Glycoside hydrolase, family 47 [Cordyceps fumosorosea ARSEF 2679]OAA62098.1 Glycoside hydrolase, family 47 [Cordyceps fumosorosea ARSEF 2679]
MAPAMRSDHLAKLRQETVDMFYHGYSNYMLHAFPEDELRPVSCQPLTRNPNKPADIGLNDVLGNYSLTLIDSLSTLAILAGGPADERYTGSQALSDFQDGVAQFVLYYGDGRPGPSGQGIRSRGFDLDSKVQVFETVIRGVGGLLSAHLFAVGDLPIRGYDPKPDGTVRGDDPLETAPISWPGGFRYDGQLLRLAFDLSGRLLPAFYTKTGIPYPRVNLRSGIPFYVNSPLHQDSGDAEPAVGNAEITETCSAGAGSLTLEFTVLSRLSGDPRFEQAAKRAFWEVWERRSDLGLIGNGIDAERGVWIGPHSGIGAGMDSFFEYALKSHILLSGQETPNMTRSQRQSTTAWLDPNSLHPPLPPEMHSSDAFLEAWHQAHASVKRHIYTDRSHFPYYSNNHRATGQPYTMWIDSLGAFYPGLLALAGEIDEAVEANLVYTALWTRYGAIPERWSVRESNVEPGIAWWPGRPEFIESTYHIYRATADPWYLRVGEMVLHDIKRRCWVACGWAGLENVLSGEKQDRMESFFLGETTKYMYLLFDPEHPLNNLDAAYVFTTEGHPLIIPHQARGSSTPRRRPSRASQQTKKDVAVYHYYDSRFTNSCPAPRKPLEPLAGSNTAAKRNLFDVSRFTNLYNTPNIHGPLEMFNIKDEDKGHVMQYRATSNHTVFPWTLPPTMLPHNGTCPAPVNRVLSWIEFPSQDAASSASSSLFSRASPQLRWYQNLGPTVETVDGLKLQLEQEFSEGAGSDVWMITHVAGKTVARHENVMFHAEHVRQFRDDAFSVLRRKDMVDVVLLVEPDEPEPAPSLRTSHELPLASMPLPVAPGSLDEITSSIDAVAENASSTTRKPAVRASDEPPAADPDSLFKSILRAVSSALEGSSSAAARGTPAPSSPFRGGHSSLDDDGDDSSGPSIYSWLANTATGAGAFPLPAVHDALLRNSPDFSAADPGASLPWRRVYMAGLACDGPLPDDAARRHQVIVMQRGGCSFGEKLDNVPSFVPDDGGGGGSLQLVVVVDDGVGDDDVPRPLLPTEQRTPRGAPRVHGIPMVLLAGARGTYELFGKAAGVGLRRKYVVKSQGYVIENAIVL